MLRPFPLLAACAVALLLVSGCDTDKPDPNYSSVTPTPSTSDTSPTPTDSTPAPNTTANVPPGAVEPTLPAVSRTNTYDGAFSFAAYYWRMVSWAYATNDSTVISGLYAGSCTTCASFQNSISKNVAYGYLLAGGLIAIDEVAISKSLDNTPGAQYAIDCALSVGQLVVKDGSGKTVQSYPATKDRQRMYLAWVGNRWQVIDTAKVVG